MKKSGREFVDQIIHNDCVSEMATLPDNCIPLTVTSPPYDKLRRYGGQRWSFETFEKVARQLFRLTMPGGVVLWVVQDGTVDGSLTGTSARQWLYFQQIGFDLNSVLILATRGWRSQTSRYANQFHFGFVLSKGRPRAFHPIRDRINSTAGQRLRCSRRSASGEAVTTYNGDRRLGLHGYRANVWFYDVGGGKSTKDRYASRHEALMPEQMARDLIISWSRPGDLIFDPFCGAATTCKMALLSHRHYLGIEAHALYYRLALRRMRDAQTEYRRQLDAWLVGA
jgi:site-specific DNA-methyltransferase (adenine-specific)